MARYMREEEERKRQQQGGGPPPGAMQVGQQFMGGGAGGGAGGGSGGGSAMGAAAPWAALAAVIIANESSARDNGRRSKNAGHHLQQALTGEGMAIDMEAMGDKVGGIGGKSIKQMGVMGSPVDATKSAYKHMIQKPFKKPFEPWEWF